MAEKSLTSAIEDDPGQLHQWVGRSETTTDTADRTSAVGLRALLDYTDGPAEDHLSPLGHWLHFRPSAAQSELGEDGHPRLGAFMPPVPLPRRMWAGSRIDFHSPIRFGQPLRRETTVESVEFKRGSTGNLCFVVLRHEVSAGEVPALSELQTLVYREAGTPAQASTTLAARLDALAPEGWDWVRPIRPEETTLFRYSALTFNSHRIHYDLPYATKTEGYPGLVVHGPLSATLLVDGFLRNNPGSELTKFRFSAKRPLFVNGEIQFCGRHTGANSADLAALGPDGQIAVTAQVEFQ